VRIIRGAPIRRVSQITPHIHVGGQYRQRGWPALRSRGITAVINLRTEFDDAEAGIAPPNYLYLPAIDDHAPSLEQLRQGSGFIENEISAGGAVYIHCGSGIGRAPTMAAGYFLNTGLTPDQAWAKIREVRPFIRPTAPQLDQIAELADQLAEEEPPTSS
jgi:protein-tyrosine phosphatase